ncbi:MAG: DUF2723 domain-containing protein [Bacteroidetes bacterium]|nr:DUF2723 domain-containing protein [Bacteroidota bacterium]
MSKAKRRSQPRTQNQETHPASPAGVPAAGIPDADIPLKSASHALAWLTPRRAAWIVGILSFVLYIITMNPSFGFVDKGELVAVASTLGIAHPTGYPTIMLIGYAFTKIMPFRPVVSLNIMSAIFTAAGAAVLVFLYSDLIRRAARRSRAADGGKQKQGRNASRRQEADTAPAAESAETVEPTMRTAYAALAALFTACTATWWNQGNGFEVYSLHALMMPLVTLLFLRFADDLEGILLSGTDRYRISIRRGGIFALFVGLSFTNHMSTILLAPAFIFYYLWIWIAGARAMRAGGTLGTPANWLAFTGRFLLQQAYLGAMLAAGLLPYIWLPIRAAMNPQFNWGSPTTLQLLFDHVSGKIYQVYMFDNLETFHQQTSFFLGGLPSELAYAGIVVCVLGGLLLARRSEFAAPLMVVLSVLGFYYAGNFTSIPIKWLHMLALFGIAAFVLMGLAWKTTFRLGVFVTLIFMTCLIYTGFYDIMEIGPYFMTAIFAAGILCALGMAWLHERLGARAGLGIACALVVATCWSNFADSNEHGNTIVEDMAVNVMGKLPQKAIIFSGQWDFWVAGSFYLQGVESYRPDVLVVDPELLRRVWYIDELEHYHPEFMSRVKPEVAAFRRAVYNFDHDLPFNADSIQNAYVGMMNAMIDRWIDERPIHVTGDVIPEVGAKYRRTPFCMTLRLMKDSTYLPQDFPDYRFSFWKGRVDSYVAKAYELYGRAALARGIYEEQNGHHDLALRYLDFALTFDPGFTNSKVPDLQLNSEDQVHGMIGFFDDVRTMRAQAGPRQ